MHADQKIGLRKLMFKGKVHRKRGRGCPQANNLNNITSWIGFNSKKIFKLAQERERRSEANPMQ